MPMASKEQGERVKRKGLKLEQGSAKKIKTSEEVSKEDLKEMMQLVPVEEATKDKEMELWVELKRLSKPNFEDQLWTHNQNLMHDPLDWKLYDTCGVHHVSTKDQEIFIVCTAGEDKDYSQSKTHLSQSKICVSYSRNVSCSRSNSWEQQKVVKALYGLHQAPRAWYETLANYLLENGFQRGKIDQTLFIKRQKGDILLVQIYVDDIISGATNKDLCKSFEKLMKKKFQMSSMGELTFFLGLQVKKKKDGIFISQDKYVIEILWKFRSTDGKSASTPIDIEKPLLKDPNGKDVDVHTYRSMIGVKTPRCDEDMLELMELMIFLLPKVEKVGIGVSVVDLQVSAVRLMLLMLVQKFLMFRLTNWCCSLSAVRSSIKYALTVNPNIYVSYIKQFWTTVDVKKVNDVIRLQALVDKKKVVVAKATIREALHLDDAEGVECKGFFGVDTPLFEGMLVAQVVVEEGDAKVHGEDVNASDAAEGDISASNDEVPTVAEEPSISSPTPPTPPLQPSHDISSNF
nr:putative ribonuclease H-like domain-containing protein [Tanacetum cinerariifolium]